MEQFRAANGTRFGYDPELKAPILIIEDPETEDSASKVTKLDAADILEFAEMLFNKGKYESIAKLIIRAGDVLLIRTPPNLAQQALDRIEASVIKGILEPLKLVGKVEVVTLDGALDIEVVSRD